MVFLLLSKRLMTGVRWERKKGGGLVQNWTSADKLSWCPLQILWAVIVCMPLTNEALWVLLIIQERGQGDKEKKSGPKMRHSKEQPPFPSHLWKSISGQLGPIESSSLGQKSYLQSINLWVSPWNGLALTESMSDVASILRPNSHWSG